MKEYILPVSNLIVHPDTTVPLILDFPLDIKTMEMAAKETQTIILCPQKNNSKTDRKIYPIGTRGHISQILHMPDNEIHVIVQTTDVVSVDNIAVESALLTGEATVISITDNPKDQMNLVLKNKILETVNAILPSLHQFSFEKFLTKIQNVAKNYPLGSFIDSVIQILRIDTKTGVEILKKTTWNEKLSLLLEQTLLSLEEFKLQKSIQRKVREKMEQGQRQMMLQEQMKAIQEEMGDESEEVSVQKIKNNIESSEMPTEAKEKALSEFKRMRTLSPMSQEGGLLKTYLDELLSMPWKKQDKFNIDLKQARDILDSEHSGMLEVKERILEHIAVMKKTGKNHGNTICFVGAPGVGKTSLCKSIANALGRKYCRISLGGISDEAHFRGHRKTYIGAQCGRIMDALKRCKTNNPVIVLDEIDKMGHDWRGDPESALLEILDPEQNKTFRDHYLEVDFDLSNVLFIATANSLNMSSALKDRMEIIEIPGYTMNEKIHIAREHLLKRAANNNGWDINNIEISDKALEYLIQNYTSEQGVRNLQRVLETLLRRTLLENDGEDAKTNFTIEKIDKLLALHAQNAGPAKIGFSARL